MNKLIKTSNGMSLTAFQALCLFMLGAALLWVPTYAVMSPLDLIILVGFFTIPLIASAIFLPEGKWNFVCSIWFAFMALYTHPFMNLYAMGIEHSYQSGSVDGEASDYPEGMSLEESETLRYKLLEDAFDKRLSYEKRTTAGLALAKRMRYESIKDFERYQPKLFWMYPPSVVLLLLAGVVAIFGVRFPREKD